MRPRRTDRSNAVFQLPGGNEDNDLWVERGEQDGEPTLTSTWEPDAEERKALAAGGTLDLTVWGTGTPPIALSVGEPLANRRHRPRRRR